MSEQAGEEGPAVTHWKPGEGKVWHCTWHGLALCIVRAGQAQWGLILGPNIQALLCRMGLKSKHAGMLAS